jgi:hypothetical protein
VAAFDYAALAGVADALIEQFGRDVTLVKASRTPASSSQPHLGPTASASTTLAAKAVFGDTREIDRPETTGDQRFRATEVVIRVLEVGEEDLATYRHLDDGGSLRRIVTANPIKPGGQTVVWLMELEA